ncbi:MAG: protoporphyrinogen oxidase [Nitriliruptorales bacterium]|nr:protoporphyrinogen oxidase [Nitriliruptorales bacterium]
MTRRVAVIGGGITGLTAAAELAHRGADVTLFEASQRLGGKLRTEEFAGRAVDVGADAFLGRQRHAKELAEQLGFTAALRAPIESTVWLAIEGQLRQLPSGTFFGIPTRLGPVAGSQVLSARALWQVATEPVRARGDRWRGDASVAAIVAQRFGTEVVDRLVEPLLGGVYAGRADQLSAEATIPPLAAAAQQGGSLRRGLRRRAPSGDNDDPVFLTIQGGLGRLVDALATRIPDTRLASPVSSVVPASGGWSVVTDGGEHTVDAVVLAVPAYAAADIVEDLSPAATRELGAMRYASVAVASLALPTTALRRVPRGSGLLVPRSAGRLVKAVTWSSWKWPHHAAAEGQFLLRASVGRIDAPPPDVDDEVLVERIVRDLSQIAGVAASPTAWRVTRWDRSLPQYEVGHRDRVERIKAAVQRDAPGIVLAGAAYDGVGVAHCVRQGQEAAATLLV